MKSGNPREPDERQDLYRLSAQSWDAKFRSGNHYATDRPFDGLVAVAEELRHRHLERVLDAGCGDGRNLRLLTTVSARVFGLDLAEEGLRGARRRPDVQDAAIAFVRGDIGRLPFRDGALDALVNVWVMNHGTDENIRQYVAEMARVLRPGGVLFASITGWGPLLALTLPFVARRIADSSPGGHTYLLDFRNEKGIHHFFTRREIDSYFGQWRILRLTRERYRTESPFRVPFWNVLAEKM
jgi:SAM-dependent methyltransferase